MKFTRRHAALAAGVCAIGLVFYLSPAGLELRARSHWALEDLRGGARLWLWRDSLRMASARLVAGSGPETFGLEFPRYQSVELSRSYPDFYHESPHNIFLDALVSEGIPGLAVLAGFTALAWFALRRAASQAQLAARYFGAAVVAALVSGLFVSFTLPGALYFYTTVAMLTGLALPQMDTFEHSATPMWLRVSALASGAIAAALFLDLAVRVTASDVALERAQQALDVGSINDAIATFTWSQRWHPAGSSDDLYFSRVLAAKSKPAANPAQALMFYQQGLMIARRAAETSEEQQNAWYNLAAFYAAQNDAHNVEACLRRSITASPNWFKSHWAFAQMLLLSGRRTEAMAEAVRAADLDGGKDPEIANFLQSVHDLPGTAKTK